MARLDIIERVTVEGNSPVRTLGLRCARAGGGVLTLLCFLTLSTIAQSALATELGQARVHRLPEGQRPLAFHAEDFSQLIVACVPRDDVGTGSTTQLMSYDFRTFQQTSAAEVTGVVRAVFFERDWLVLVVYRPEAAARLELRSAGSLKLLTARELPAATFEVRRLYPDRYFEPSFGVATLEGLFKNIQLSLPDEVRLLFQNAGPNDIRIDRDTASVRRVIVSRDLQRPMHLAPFQYGIEVLGNEIPPGREPRYGEELIACGLLGYPEHRCALIRLPPDLTQLIYRDHPNPRLLPGRLSIRLDREVVANGKVHKRIVAEMPVEDPETIVTSQGLSRLDAGMNEKYCYFTGEYKGGYSCLILGRFEDAVASQLSLDLRVDPETVPAVFSAGETVAWDFALQDGTRPDYLEVAQPFVLQVQSKTAAGTKMTKGHRADHLDDETEIFASVSDLPYRPGSLLELGTPLWEVGPDEAWDAYLARYLASDSTALRVWRVNRSQPPSAPLVEAPLQFMFGKQQRLVAVGTTVVVAADPEPYSTEFAELQERRREYLRRADPRPINDSYGSAVAPNAAYLAAVDSRNPPDDSRLKELDAMVPRFLLAWLWMTVVILAALLGVPSAYGYYHECEVDGEQLWRALPMSIICSSTLFAVFRLYDLVVGSFSLGILLMVVTLPLTPLVVWLITYSFIDGFRYVSSDAVKWVSGMVTLAYVFLVFLPVYTLPHVLELFFRVAAR